MGDQVVRGTMALMPRALILAQLVVVMPRSGASQELSVLHVRVALVDAENRPTPVPRHALLVSDNPATAPPRRIVTAADGTVDVRLRPGTYTVESDQPVAFNGRSYQWTQMIDIVAGRDASLELTAGNARSEPFASTAAPSDASSENDPSFLLPRWQESVVAVWTPTSRASGFVADSRGLVATNQRVIGDARSVEVQLTAAIKVAARVLAADPVRDVAVLWIDPRVAGAARPLPLDCERVAMSPVADGEEVFTIAARLRGERGLASGILHRVGPREILADFGLDGSGAGGPVFTAGGAVIGMTSVGDEQAVVRGSRVVPVDDACEVLGSAGQKMAGAVPPSGTHLPVEPPGPFPLDALEDAVRRRAGSLKPYQMSSSDFDIAFITPVQAYAALRRSAPGGGPEGDSRTLPPEEARMRADLLTDFGHWSEYVADHPQVLLVRATPKLTEGFWTRLGRGAAWTQGITLPPIKRFTSGFSRMRAFCGSAEVTPIHPFKIERRMSESDVMFEGLYVYGPGALGPQCGTVKLVLYAEKTPDKGDTRVVDPTVLQQIRQDFAPGG